MMPYRANRIADRFRNHAGHVVKMPAKGQTFDDANDIHIGENGMVSFRFEGWDAKGARAHFLNEHYQGEITIGLLTDAVIHWERHHNNLSDNQQPEYEDDLMLNGADCCH